MTMTPVRYLPRRVASLIRKGVLKRSHGKAAALFCYFEEHEWLLYSGVSTNFPKGYKVQSSPKGHSSHPGKSQAKPPKLQYLFLREFLVLSRSFADCARAHHVWRDSAEAMPSPRTLHRLGTQYLRQYLEYFEKLLAVDHRGKSP